MMMLLSLAVGLALFFGIAFASRATLRGLAPTHHKPTFRDMPLTASFGIAIILLYILVAILVIAAVDATRVYRLARSVSQGIVVMDYIEAARLRGESNWRLIRREILPNAMAPLVAEFGLRFCFVFLAISALSFLGLGIKPPTADWGSMVRENATLITFGDITPLLPAGAIALLTVAVNFVVDWQLHRASGLKE